MGFLKISPAGNTSLLQFAGDVLNKIHDYLSGINIASTDSSNKPDIATETRYRSGNLRVFDNDQSHEYYFDTSAINMSEHKKVKFPTLTASEDTLLFASQPAVVTGKTIDYDLNTILNWPPPAGEILGYAQGGVATFSGTGSQTQFLIPHLMGNTPQIYFALPKTTDALGKYTVSADATNIIITYAIPPPGGSANNVNLVWAAGNPTEGGDTLISKTIGDKLLFVKVTAPSNPALEECAIYWKQIDANNNGLFIKGKKNGVIVEGQIW